MGVSRTGDVVQCKVHKLLLQMNEVGFPGTTGGALLPAALVSGDHVSSPDLLRNLHSHAHTLTQIDT